MSVKRREEAEQRQADEEARQQQQQPGAAVEQLTDATRQSFQIPADRTVALGEGNLRLTQHLFQNWMQAANQAGQQEGQASSQTAPSRVRRAPSKPLSRAHVAESGLLGKVLHQRSRVWPPECPSRITTICAPARSSSN